ncbi:MAG: hypothetical protein OSJ24_03760 [Muribaculaceae bacterium]|nr:hypothetical protein [Muribaculaceae bacterium]
MRLIFKKNYNGDIEVQIEKGTTLMEFNYIEMLRQLLEKNEISEECVFEGLEAEEVSVLKKMLSEITNAVDKGLRTPIK